MKAQHIKLHFTIIAILSVILFSACEFEDYDNGKLDGAWKLCSIESLATGSTKDLTDAHLFWAFQGKLLLMQDKSGINVKYFWRFHYEDDFMNISQPTKEDKQNGDEILTDITPLNIFGVSSPEETFLIEKLSKSEMCLQNETVKLKFIKF